MIKKYEAEKYDIETYIEDDEERIKFISKEGNEVDVLTSDMVSIILDSFRHKNLSVLNFNSKMTKMVKVERTINFEIPLIAKDGAEVDHINFFQDVPLEIALSEKAKGMCDIPSMQYYEIPTDYIKEEITNHKIESPYSDLTDDKNSVIV